MHSISVVRCPAHHNLCWIPEKVPFICEEIDLVQRLCAVKMLLLGL